MNDDKIKFTILEKMVIVGTIIAAIIFVANLASELYEAFNGLNVCQ